MEKVVIDELPAFEYTPQGFNELKAALKAGKIVRNPFAKFYNEKVEVTTLTDTDSRDEVRLY
ncbi:MAG: hypothetical protein LBC96_03190 [Lachnospiraceae bacterium]|nr:hypothetical protein [Lachnospiraceae bacterium]